MTFLDTSMNECWICHFDVDDIDTCRICKRTCHASCGFIVLNEKSGATKKYNSEIECPTCRGLEENESELRCSVIISVAIEKHH